MGFLINNEKETREFNYKPRFYDPDAENATGDRQTDFANKLHREWNSKRRHDASKKQFSWLPIMTMVFFALLLAFIFFKFFA